MQQKKKKGKALALSFIAAGVALAVYSLIFPFHR